MSVNARASIFEILGLNVPKDPREFRKEVEREFRHVNNGYRRLHGKKTKERNHLWHKLCHDLRVFTNTEFQTDDPQEFGELRDAFKTYIDGGAKHDKHKGGNQRFLLVVYWMYVNQDKAEQFRNKRPQTGGLVSDEVLFRKLCNRAANRLFRKFWSVPIEEHIRSLDNHTSYNTTKNPNAQKTAPTEPISKVKASPSSEKTHAPLIPLPHFDKDTQVSWLNPFRQDAIPFVPRVEERQRLDDFISSKKPFQICALIGPSGAGKTRFAAELMRDLDDTNEWLTGFVDKDDPAPVTSWDQWIPYQQNTLIVVDYTYATGELVNSIIKKCDPQSKNVESYSGKRVRLILLNHVFDQSPFFNGALTQHRIDFFHRHSPIELKGGDHLLRQIVKQTSGSNNKSEQIIDQAIAHLKTMGPAAQHPLFAALLGQTIKDGVDFENWSRRDLINNYLNSSIRLPWLAEQAPDQTGRWIGILISIATLLRGADRYTLSSAIPDEVGSTSSQDVMKQCMAIVSSSNASTLKHLEPDILGESYFLQFLKFALVNKSVMSAFFDTLCDASTQKDEEIIVENFVESIGRLAKNLTNDKIWNQRRDQNCVERVGDEAQADWNNLLKFLTLSDFPENNLFQRIRFIVLSKVTEVLTEADLKDLAEQFFSHVNFADIPENICESHFLGVLEAFLITYDYSISNRRNCQEFDNYFSKFARDFEENTDLGINSLIFATLTGSVPILDRQLNHGALVNKPDTEGKTALMYAAESGHLSIIQRLCEEDLLLVDNVDDDGNTALIHAAGNNHHDVVVELMEAGADINWGNNERDTALSEAIRYGCLEVVDLLLKRRAAIVGKHKYQYSALMYASMRDHKDIILRLLEEPELNVNETNSLGENALMAACIFGAYDAVDTLLKNGACVDSQDDHGNTALMNASRNNAHGSEQIHTVKIILKEKPNITLKNKYGETALTIAKENYHYNIAELLENYENT